MDHKYIKGSFSRSFFEGNNGYLIGIMKLKETNIEVFEDYLNKTITFTGYFDSLNTSDTYIFYGEEVEHPRFGLQFAVSSYEKVKPTDKLGVISFLSSDLFPGIGEAIATSIVDTIGENALDLILENPNILNTVPKLNDKKKNTIITNLEKYDESHKIIVYLSELGFSMKEALSIYNLYKEYTMDKIGEDIYDIIENIDIPFTKVDRIALNMGYSEDDTNRIKACIIYSMINTIYTKGDTYLDKKDIYSDTMRYLNIDNYVYDFDTYLSELEKSNKIVIDNGKYYLKSMWDDEDYIIDKIKKLSNIDKSNYKLDKYIDELEKVSGIIYNDNQKKAITDALTNNILLITGGPGTGKTTIIKAIVDLYSEINSYKTKDLLSRVALLAPTGRAAKRMSESCLLGASTIHRFLKWNKESESFAINEFNKDDHDLIIVDEVSMIDIPLFASLLKGLKDNIKLILVGDYNQLPSVGPGELLKDLIDSNMINTIYLDKLYRQDENSYIVSLASEIKDNNISENFLEPRSDYIFLECNSFMIKESLKNIINRMIEKDINMKNVQIMAPMYKGENGIDSLNKTLQSVINPSSNDKRELVTGDITYREGDKILQLVNMPDDNVYNGDIGIITRIEKNKGKDEIYISFDGNIVKYTPKDFSKITHGYIISIHKSQGSEFDTIILPMSHSYNRMLYRKLIYTGVTRAKRKLIFIGEASAFLYGVSNNKEDLRKTDLKNKLENMYKIYLDSPQ
ncbi:MAG: ATP-dependent RecD-like DNA helicase [Bacilli bacterium]|nr:ATP-dependent RecD-like DNA helicase [Bacilli bacterium]